MVQLLRDVSDGDPDKGTRQARQEGKEEERNGIISNITNATGEKKYRYYSEPPVVWVGDRGGLKEI